MWLYATVTALTCSGARRDTSTFTVQTSKDFDRIINDTRSIWFHVASQLIREDYLAPYSLPISSADARSLKSIATRSQRFLFATRRRWAKEPAPAPPDYALDSSSKDYIYDDGLKSPFQFHQVLPGGRWLVTANSSDTEGRLCCRDLHHLSRPAVVYTLRKPIAIFDEVGEGDSECPVVCQASPKDQSVTIMVRTCSADGQ